MHREDRWSKKTAIRRPIKRNTLICWAGWLLRNGPFSDTNIIKWNIMETFGGGICLELWCKSACECLSTFFSYFLQLLFYGVWWSSFLLIIIDRWQTGQIITIHKKGDQCTCTHYKGITLIQEPLYKLLELNFRYCTSYQTYNGGVHKHQLEIEMLHTKLNGHLILFWEKDDGENNSYYWNAKKQLNREHDFF